MQYSDMSLLPLQDCFPLCFLDGEAVTSYIHSRMLSSLLSSFTCVIPHRDVPRPQVTLSGAYRAYPICDQFDLLAISLSGHKGFRASMTYVLVYCSIVHTFVVRNVWSHVKC